MKVKMLTASFTDSLESEINRWLDTYSKNLAFVAIKYAVADRDSLHRHNAMIIYEE